MATGLQARLDGALGDGLEAAVKLKHRRRLERLGWGRAFAPVAPGAFAEGDPPPRLGCALDVLVDGGTALPQMMDALAAAQRFVHVAGWHLEPAFQLDRSRPGSAIGTLLAELAERVDVRVLVWSGAPLPAFHPSRRDVSRSLANLVRHTRIQARGDPREHPLHCHHEKTVVIDGEVAFVGGIDLTDSAGDRYDGSAHAPRRRIGWHDVATRLRGPAVADVDGHFRMRWQALTGQRLQTPAVPPRAGQTTVQVVRTVAEDMYAAVPRGDFRIFESYSRALRSAQRFIYIESQFLWAPELVSIIADKLRHPPTPDFRVVALLPGRANNGQEDTRGQVGVLIDADDGAERFLAATIRARTPGAARTDPIYVHAKIAIIDDAWMIVGSANLNAHSMFNDTEMCVVTDDAELARATRVRLWSEHLEMDEAQVAAGSPAALVDEAWRPIARRERERRDAGIPATHRLLELPGVSRRTSRLLGPLTGLLDDG